MRLQPIAVLTLIGALSLPASAQDRGVYSRAVPPDQSAIERLNLKTVWTVNLPVSGRKDSIAHIQPLDDQVFVQTRAGLLIALDALTGRVQWSAQLGAGNTVSTYPVAANSRFVFAANLTKLYSFHRYTGVVDFTTEMGSPPTAGLAADETGVYCALEGRTGSSGANRVLVYDLPPPIAITGAARPLALDANGKPIYDPKSVNPVDDLTKRYAPEGVSRSGNAEIFESTKPQSTEAPVVGMTGSRTPSLSSLPRMTPPYTLRNDSDSPSINVLSSFRQPYRYKNDFQKDIQQSPSIGTIPPSVAAALALSDLKPRNVEPPLRWQYGLTTRVEFPATITPLRAWLLTEGNHLIALNKIDKKKDADEVLIDPISAPAGRAGLHMYIPLGSGYLVAAEGTTGELGGGARVEWRTTVGGINNRTPYVTDGFVYTQGDNSGVVCLDRKKGEIIWRSESTDDRILAGNKEFIYVRNHQGRVQVYDAKRPTDPARKRSLPLAGLDFGDFNIPVMNTASDRLLMAADNGLIVCLRDLSPKYARPMKICPEIAINYKPGAGKDGKDGKDQPPMDKLDKKEPGK